MLDWAKIANALEQAQTLDDKAAAAFLETAFPDRQTRDAAQRILGRSQPGAAFMQTSVPGEEEMAPASDLAAGAQIGVWKIDGLIGRGGMGEVYRAHRADGIYDQAVALKLINANSAARAMRFETERRRLAQMEHPGIARIVDGGTAPDGRAYMTMELVDGAPIDRHVDTSQMDRSARLRLFVGLCRAVSHAHSRLILHRDIKAENVLVDANGEVRLIDFGIASSLDDDEGSQSPLTISSAAPEQFSGDPVSIQTDIFALGVLLHRLLTGRFPERMADGSMAPDEERLKSPDLSAILACCLRARASDRYVSADALVDDVVAFLEKRPVGARQGGRLYRIGRFFTRYPIASTLGAVAIFALVGGLVTSQKFANAAQAEAQRANEALEQVQWQWGRAESGLGAQQAYSDILQRAFGSDADVEHLSQIMLERLGEAFDQRETDPDTAASLSYAVGRNFYFRGDTKRALEVFDAWMAEKFGPEPLLGLGLEVYALMLVDGGRPDEAEPILRRLISEFDNGYRTSRADLFNYAFKLARITKSSADVDRAEALVLELIAADTEPFQTLFHYNQLGFLRMAKSDRQGAYEAFTRTVETFEANPNLAAYGRDIARINVAGQELGFRRDLDRADQIITSILEEDVPLKGESLQEGRAHLLRGLVLSERGETSAARDAFVRADELLARFGGIGSPPQMTGLTAWAAIEARAGRIAEAGELLARARQSAGEGETDPKIEMADVFLRAAQGATQADLVPALTEENFLKSVNGDAVQYYLYQLLVEDGLAAALPNGVGR